MSEAWDRNNASHNSFPPQPRHRSESAALRTQRWRAQVRTLKFSSAQSHFAHFHTIAVDDELLFYGQDGTESCDRFISRVTGIAFTNGKTGDSAWVANLAATGLRGEAMRWWMDLDDDIQSDWKQLRKALVGRYPHNGYLISWTLVYLI